MDPQSTMKIASITLVALCLIHQSKQHGYIEFPAQRGSLWREGYATPVNYNDNALYCGGREAFVKAEGRCGVCGDPYYGERQHEAGGTYALGVIAASYPAGTTVIKSTIRLTTHHKGFFEFRICPHDNPDTPVTQECLDRNILRIKGATAKSQFTRYYPEYPKGGDGIYRLVLEIPAGIRCKQCVLSWRYKTGNSWGTEKNGKSCLGCGLQEEFRNCADISIGYDNITPGSVLTSHVNSNQSLLWEDGAIYPQNARNSKGKNFKLPDNTQTPKIDKVTKTEGDSKSRIVVLSDEKHKELLKNSNTQNKIKNRKSINAVSKKINKKKTTKSQQKRLLLRKPSEKKRKQSTTNVGKLISNTPLLSQVREAHDIFVKLQKQKRHRQLSRLQQLQKARKRTQLAKRQQKKTNNFRQVIPRVKTVVRNQMISAQPAARTTFRTRLSDSALQRTSTRREIVTQSSLRRLGTLSQSSQRFRGMVTPIPIRQRISSASSNIIPGLTPRRQIMFSRSRNEFEPRFPNTLFSENDNRLRMPTVTFPPLNAVNSRIYIPNYFNDIFDTGFSPRGPVSMFG